MGDSSDLTSEGISSRWIAANNIAAPVERRHKASIANPSGASDAQLVDVAIATALAAPNAAQTGQSLRLAPALRAEALLALQRAVGNREVQRLIVGSRLAMPGGPVNHGTPRSFNSLVVARDPDPPPSGARPVVASSARAGRRATGPAGLVAQVSRPAPAVQQLSPAQATALAARPLSANLRVNGAPVGQSSGRDPGRIPTTTRRPRIGSGDPPRPEVAFTAASGAPQTLDFGLELTVRDVSPYRLRRADPEIRLLTGPTVELRLAFERTDAGQEIPLAASVSAALFRIAWENDSRELLELLLGQLEVAGEQNLLAPFGPSVEMGAGAEITFRPTRRLSFVGSASSRLGTEAGQHGMAPALAGEAEARYEAHPNFFLFARTEGRLTFGHEGPRGDWETPVLVGLRFEER